MSPVYSVVERDMHIVGVRSEILFLHLWDVCEGRLLGRRDDLYISEFFSFLGSLLCPRSRDYIISLTGFSEQVQRYHGELQRTSALYKHHLVVIRYIHDIPEVLLSVLKDGLELRRPVAHFHHRLTAALIIGQICSCVLYDTEGQHGRTCREIIRSFVAHLITSTLY